MKSRKNSIRKKIRRSFLLVSVLSLAVSGFITVAGMLDIRNASANIGHEIGNQAALSSHDALLSQALVDITALAETKADVIDSELGGMARTLEVMAEVLSGLHANRGNYQNLPFNHPRFNTGMRREMQWTLSPGMVTESTGTVDDLIEAGVLDETFLKGNMELIFEAVMNANPSISSIYVASESGVNVDFDDHSLAKLTDSVATDVFEFRDRYWYLGVKQNLRTYVTDAYYDIFGRGLTVSMSAPYFGEGGEFAGVMGIDILIEDLVEYVLSVVTAENGYAILLRAWGTDTPQIIAAYGMGECNEDNLWLFLGSAADEVAAAMRYNMSGVAPSALLRNGVAQDMHVVWAYVDLTGWTYAIVVPTGDIIAPSELLREHIGTLTDYAVHGAQLLIVNAVVIQAILFLAVMVAVVFVAMRVSAKITKPITTLASDIKTIGNGNLEYVSSINTGDEIEELSLSFQRMTVELKQYISNLARVTAEKERIGAELDVATKIQASMLPRIFPPFPNRPQFDVYATMLPAKEVGGDFYDFFLIDENKLAVVVADVSDKGVPAALFMVIAKTLIKNTAQSGKSPKEVFEIVNDMLCEGNDTNMFVTAFMGVLDISGGRFSYVNAGHNPPLIKRGNGRFEWLPAKPGLVLAAVRGVPYREDAITLNNGDSLYLYTDGVTEAVNLQNKLFGDSRLLESANKHRNHSPKELLTSIKQEIDVFADGAEQADDITMLILEITGGSS